MATVVNQPRLNQSQLEPVVASQPESANPFNACLAVKNSSELMVNNAKNAWNEASNADKACTATYFCAAPLTGTGAIVATIGFGVAPALLAGVVCGLAVGVPSSAGAYAIVHNQEQKNTEKKK